MQGPKIRHTQPLIARGGTCPAPRCEKEKRWICEIWEEKGPVAPAEQGEGRERERDH